MSEDMKQESFEGAFGDGIPPVDPASEKEVIDRSESADSSTDIIEQASLEELAALTPEQERVKNLVITVIRTVFDPEIPVNIYELGLIYAVEVSTSNDVKVKFTLTSPNCPAAQDLPMEMERKIKSLEGIGEVTMELTWEPTWTPELMTEAAKLQLNMF